MKSKAAFILEPNARIEIDEIDVAPPQSGEVLVEMVSATVSHRDWLAVQGRLQDMRYPCVLGHEGAGRVLEVGPDVKGLLPGDPVIPLTVPECGQCPGCLNPRTNFCEALSATQPLGLMPDGTTRFTWQGQPLYHFQGTSTFSERIVLPEIACARIHQEVPLEAACLLGGTASAGFGAVFNRAGVRPGSTVAVFGLGGLGLCVIQAAVMAQAARIIGIDNNLNKFELARVFGATDCVNPRDHADPLANVLTELTNGGVDHAFDCIGSSEMMTCALASAHPGWGKATFVADAPNDQTFSIPTHWMSSSRHCLGSVLGGYKGRSQLPELADQLRQGEVQLDPLITHRLPLSDVQLSMDLLQSGEAIRCVIDFR